MGKPFSSCSRPSRETSPHTSHTRCVTNHAACIVKLHRAIPACRAPHPLACRRTCGSDRRLHEHPRSHHNRCGFTQRGSSVGQIWPCVLDHQTTSCAAPAEPLAPALAAPRPPDPTCCQRAVLTLKFLAARFDQIDLECGFSILETLSMPRPFRLIQRRSSKPHLPRNPARASGNPADPVAHKLWARPAMATPNTVAHQQAPYGQAATAIVGRGLKTRCESQTWPLRLNGFHGPGALSAPGTQVLYRGPHVTIVWRQQVVETAAGGFPSSDGIINRQPSHR